MGNLLTRFIFVDQLLQKPKHMKHFGTAHIVNIDFLWNCNKGHKNRSLDNNIILDEQLLIWKIFDHVDSFKLKISKFC